MACANPNFWPICSDFLQVGGILEGCDTNRQMLTKHKYQHDYTSFSRH